jgi:two-component system nitrate/nitrite response regulator NarL
MVHRLNHLAAGRSSEVGCHERGRSGNRVTAIQGIDPSLLAPRLPTRSGGMSVEVQVLVLDGHPVSAYGVGSVLSQRAGLKVVGVTSRLRDAIELPQPPDVVILDPMTLEDGIRAVRGSQDAYPHVKVVVHSSSERRDHVQEAISLGARGYVYKRLPIETLIGAVELIAADDCVVAPSFLAGLLRQPAGAKDYLSRYEVELLSYVAEGAANAQIARHMHLSTSSVKRRLSAIESRLGARNRIEAASRAARLGVI